MARAKKLSVVEPVVEVVEPVVKVETIVSEVVGKIEVTTELAPVEVETEAAPEVKTGLPSLISQVSALGAETKVKKAKATKNENVWGNVRMLFDQGKSNKETLALIHEMYGNTSTSYACIAWYRNKYNKVAKSDKLTIEQLLNQVACQFGQDQDWVAAQLSKV